MNNTHSWIFIYVCVIFLCSTRHTIKLYSNLLNYEFLKSQNTYTTTTKQIYKSKLSINQHWIEKNSKHKYICHKIKTFHIYLTLQWCSKQMFNCFDEFDKKKKYRVLNVFTNSIKKIP